MTSTIREGAARSLPNGAGAPSCTPRFRLLRRPRRAIRSQLIDVLTANTATADAWLQHSTRALADIREGDNR